jgi:hypothetical protein
VKEVIFLFYTKTASLGDNGRTKIVILTTTDIDNSYPPHGFSP